MSRPRPPRQPTRHPERTVAKQRTLMAVLLHADPSPLQADDTPHHDIRQLPAQAATSLTPWRPSWNLGAQDSMTGWEGAKRPLRDRLRLFADWAATTTAAFVVDLWAEGSALLGDLIGNALHFSVYHLRQWTAALKKARYNARHKGRSQLQPSAVWNPGGATWIRHLCDQREVIRPFSAICDGDVIVVGTGEMIPLSGTVTDGTAWLRCFPQTPRLAPGRTSTDDQAGVQETPTNGTSSDYTIVTVGHQVQASCIVEVGRLHIGVRIN